MKYVCFGSNNLIYNILDMENKKFLSVYDGVITDKTKECEKMYKTYRRSVESGKCPDAKMGVRYYEYLNSEIDLSQCVYNNSIIFQTDNRKELDLFILESVVKQLEFKLADYKVYIDRIQKGEIDSTLYTYR